MGKAFNYIGLEYIDMPRDERPYYCEFGAIDTETGEKVLEFYTNKSLEGRFVHKDDGTYQQTAGTCQFSLGGLSKQTVRKYLREWALDADKMKKEIDAEKQLVAEYFSSPEGLADLENSMKELEESAEDMES
jgi:hypothetical protein